MNQKQRDYLIKRLDEIRKEKVRNLKSDPIDKESYLKKVRLINTDKIINLVTKEIKEDMENFLDRSYYNAGQNIKINIADIVTNAREVYESYDKAKDKSSEATTQKTQSINRKYDELCDKLIFANDYEEASKLIAEFTKF